MSAFGRHRVGRSFGRLVALAGAFSLLPALRADEPPILWAIAGHGGAVETVLIAPDGASIYSGSNDGTIKEWSVATGAYLRTVVQRNSRIVGMGVSPDGQTLVCACFDGMIAVYQVGSGALVREMAGPQGWLCGALSPSGQYFAAAGEAAAAWVWNVATGAQVATLGGAEYDVAWSTDGQWIAAAANTGHTLVWRTSDWLLAKDVVSTNARCTAFSPVQSDVAAGGSTTSVGLWNRVTGALIRSYTTGSFNNATSIGITPTETLLVATQSSFTPVKIWDFQTGAFLRSFTGHRSSPRCVAISSDGTYAVTGETLGRSKRWRLSDGFVFKTLGTPGAAAKVLFSPDGQLALCATAGNLETIRIHSASDGAAQVVIDQSQVNDVDISPDSATLASCALFESDITLRSTFDGLVTGTLSGHTDDVTSVSFSPAAARLASCGNDGTVRIWNLTNSTLLNTLAGPDQPLVVRYSPAGSYVAAAGATGEFRVWNTGNFGAADSWSQPGERIESLAFTADDVYVVSASSWPGAQVRLWDRVSHALVRSFGGPTRSIAISPDGTKLLTAAADSIQVWSLPAGTLLHTFDQRTITASAVAFSPDSSKFLYGTGEATFALANFAVTSCFPCDMNCDGSVNQFDIQPFIDTLISHSSCSACAGDTNNDGTANTFDIQGFIGCLGG